jgi:hypothetical protein
VKAGSATFVGELAVDAVSRFGEQYDDDAVVLAASVMIVVEDRSGVHIEVLSAEIEQDEALPEAG